MIISLLPIIYYNIGKKVYIMVEISELDEVDRSILKFLRENSRMSMQEMSRLSGIPDATIQFRLKRLKANGIIESFTIEVDPAAFGLDVMAIVLVQTEADKHDEAKMALARLPEIITPPWAEH